MNSAPFLSNPTIPRPHRERQQTSIQPGGASRPLGLVSAHNAPSFHVALPHGGNLLELASFFPNRKQIGGGRRGRVVGFSQQSRSRLLKLLARCDYNKRSKTVLFITTTFRNLWPEDAGELRRVWDRFVKRLRRRYPHAAGIYRKELQERGAPHFHFFLWNVGFYPVETLEADWRAACGEYGTDLMGNATELEKLESFEKAQSYVAKYISKPETLVVVGQLGRPWGVFNRAEIPTDTLLIKLSGREFLSLRALCEQRLPVRDKTKWAPGPWDGLWLFLSYDDACELLWEVCRRPILARIARNDRYTVLRAGPYRTMPFLDIESATRSALAAAERRKDGDLHVWNEQATVSSKTGEFYP